MQTVFDFHYTNNTSGNKKTPISFFCPICGNIRETLYLYDYVAYHEFYKGEEFFCEHCTSQFVTLLDSKIKLISKSFLFN